MKKIIKYFSYFVSWILTMYIISFVYDAFFGALIAKYDSMGFPPLTEKMFLLLWIGLFALTIVATALMGDGIGKSHYVGGRKTSIRVLIINQAAASIVYVALGVAGNYHSSEYWVLTLFTNFVNGAFKTARFTQADTDWMLGVCIAHMIVYSAAGVLTYLSARRRQLIMQEIEREYRREKGLEVNA